MEGPVTSSAGRHKRCTVLCAQDSLSLYFVTNLCPVAPSVAHLPTSQVPAISGSLRVAGLDTMSEADYQSTLQSLRQEIADTLGVDVSTIQLGVTRPPSQVS